MFKYEMHLHSCGCSSCSVSSCEEMVRAAKEKDYAGVVFTNHFYHGNTCISRELPWNDFVEAYKIDYLKAKALGDEIGVQVFFGIEEGIGKGKEILIYGLNPDTIAKEFDFKYMNLKSLSEFIHSNGGVVYAAHPFRQRFYIIDPREEPDMRYLDGIEVFNNGNTQEDNDYTLEYAKKHGLAVITGGDIHISETFGSTGIATEKPITSESQLVKILKSRNHKIIINGKIL